jgi:hypothetical protein
MRNARLPAREKTRRDDLIVADRACGLSLVTIAKRPGGLQRGGVRASRRPNRTIVRKSKIPLRSFGLHLARYAVFATYGIQFGLSGALV